LDEYDEADGRYFVAESGGEAEADEAEGASGDA
jgi:hypothetical protein